MSTKTDLQTMLRPLSKTEIDQRIDTLVEGLTLGGAEAMATDARPRWISAADLVERMRPFIVLN